VFGFVLLIKCADYFVDGAASFARNFRIQTGVIGLTIVAFGTSTPELAISFTSHLSGNADMMLGNVVGSSISNIFIIVGLAVVIVPFKIREDAVKKEFPLLVLITLAFCVLLMDSAFGPSYVNGLSRADGIILILLFCIFVYYLIAMIKSGRTNSIGNIEEFNKPKHKLSKSIILMLTGLGGIILGSHLVVGNMTDLAVTMGISQKIISVTIISIGTSLPELVTIIVSAKKGEDDLTIGSIIGSNIFNICIVLGLPVVMLGPVATMSFTIIDMAFMVFSALILWFFVATGRKLKRYEGIILIAMYGFYMAYIFLQ
jgi:cation:H+ antiporter